MPTVPTVTSERRLQQQGQVSAPSLPRSGYTPRVSGGSGELMGKAVENLGKTVTQVANVMFERQVEENKRLQELEQKIKKRENDLFLIGQLNEFKAFSRSTYLGVQQTFTGENAHLLGPTYQENIQDWIDRRRESIPDDLQESWFSGISTETNRRLDSLAGIYSTQREAAVQREIDSTYTNSKLDLIEWGSNPAPEWAMDVESIVEATILTEQAALGRELTESENVAKTRELLVFAIDSIDENSTGTALAALEKWRHILLPNYYQTKKEQALSRQGKQRRNLAWGELGSIDDPMEMQDRAVSQDFLNAYGLDINDAITLTNHWFTVRGRENEIEEINSLEIEKRVSGKQKNISDAFSAVLKHPNRTIDRVSLETFKNAGIPINESAGVLGALEYARENRLITNDQYLLNLDFIRQIPKENNFDALMEVSKDISDRKPAVEVQEKIKRYEAAGLLRSDTSKSLGLEAGDTEANAAVEYITNSISLGLLVSLDGVTPKEQSEQALRYYYELRAKNPDGDRMVQAQAVVTAFKNDLIKTFPVSISSMKTIDDINVAKEKLRQDFLTLEKNGNITAEKRLDFERDYELLSSFESVLQIGTDKERIR